MSTLNQDILGYAMLIIEDLQLLIPQEQISSLEMAGDMQAGAAGDSVAGYLQFENKPWPIFCLSNNLTLLSPVPQNRNVCILLQSEHDFFGILCERALLLKPEEIQPLALPNAMLTADSPLSALAIYEDKITSISSAEHLAKILPLKTATANLELSV